MPEYRVGIVGCGNIALQHAACYQTYPGATIVAGVEPNEENARRFREATGAARMYSDYRELLEQEELDVISVCTWPRTHAEIVVAAAETGLKGIFCEKPLATTLVEADAMITAYEQHGIVLGVDHQHRWDPQSIRAKELIDAGAIGAVEGFYGHCSLDLMNNGSHVVDLIHYFNGDAPAEWVMGQIDNRSQRHGYKNHPDMYTEDMAIGRVRYANGARATIELGEFADPAYHFQAYGSEGVLDVNRPGSPPLRILSSTAQGWVHPELPAVNPRAAAIHETFHAIEQGRQHASSGRVARAALEVIIGIFESVRQRALLECPIATTDFPLASMVEAGVFDRAAV